MESLSATEDEMKRISISNEKKSLSLSLSLYALKKKKKRILRATMTRRNEEHEVDEQP
jgi:hypothetical protein